MIDLNILTVKPPHKCQGAWIAAERRQDRWGDPMSVKIMQYWGEGVWVSKKGKVCTLAN